MTPHLSHAHKSTYDAILLHPAPHNLQWRDVRSLLEFISEVTEDSPGKTRLTRNGQTLVLHAENHKDLDNDDDLKRVREYLERSSFATPPQAPSGVNLLVAINHREARIYSTELRGAVPERIVPYDPHNSGRHLHYVHNDSNGQRRPEIRSFYDEIAKSLRGADSILICGSGTGASSAMEQLVSQLTRHHSEIVSHIVGSVVIDESHQSEDQLLARAREVYSTLQASPAAPA